MHASPGPEHLWLQQLVGEWLSESEVPAHGGNEGFTSHGTESVRGVGQLFVQLEGRGDMGGAPHHSVMTIGFDLRRGRFVGSWVGSMMDHHWVYDGEFEQGGTAVGLIAEGPDFNDPTKMGTYKDTVALHADGTRTLTAHFKLPDGTWQQFMHTVYRRA